MFTAAVTNTLVAPSVEKKRPLRLRLKKSEQCSKRNCNLKREEMPIATSMCSAGFQASFILQSQSRRNAYCDLYVLGWFPGLVYIAISIEKKQPLRHRA